MNALIFRGLQPGTPLPYLQLSVSERGVQVTFSADIELFPDKSFNESLSYKVYVYHRWVPTREM